MTTCDNYFCRKNNRQVEADIQTGTRSVKKAGAHTQNTLGGKGQAVPKPTRSGSVQENAHNTLRYVVVPGILFKKTRSYQIDFHTHTRTQTATTISNVLVGNEHNQLKHDVSVEREVL